jgi:diadenosine tetraphosphatase ApaH/serine/threonine PP2A family protein phosphatase
MRLALLADIHGNREALDACLAHAARQKIDQFIFLGDMVGYGADPLYIIDRVRDLQAKGAIVLMGNHDEAAGKGSLDNMNSYARHALEWTRIQLDEESRAYLQALPLYHVIDDALFVHADASSPRAWNYITNASDAERSMRGTDRRLTFCGHVHRPQLYHMTQQKPAVLFIPQNNTPIPLVGQRKWLAVQGAVGQPRDDNPDAAYSVFDTMKQEITYFRVAYDIETAAAKIHAAQLPQILAARLFIGR